MSKIDNFIINILARPFIKFGRKIATVDNGLHASAVDFGSLPRALVGLSPTPWRRSWGTRLRKWYHLDKSTMKSLVVNENAFPVWRDAGGIYPGTWVIDEDQSGVLIGSNAIGGNHPDLGKTSIAGFHFFRLEDESLELLNEEPIPFLIWTAWKEGQSIILAGMEQRSRQAQMDDSDFEPGRPVLIRYDLSLGLWKEVAFDHEVARLNENKFVGPIEKIETWIGSEKLKSNCRVLVAAVARKGLSALDPQLGLSSRPLPGDFVSLIFVSFEKGKMLGYEPNARLVQTIRTFDRSLFVICRNLVDNGDARMRVSQLYVLDLLSHGLDFKKLKISGISDETVVSGFSAAHFGEEGLYGCFHLGEEYIFVKSSDGIDWAPICSSSEISCQSVQDFSE